jgi:hypothetical protein
MKINEILLESSDHKLPALETVYEAQWDREPIKHYGGQEEYQIHKQERFPHDPKNQRPLVNYTGNASRTWNDFLHRHYRGLTKDQDLKKYEKNISQIDRELARNVLKKDYTLYTGLPESPAKAFKLYNQPTNKPLTVHLPAYTSTTTNWDIAVEFAGRKTRLTPDIEGHGMLDVKGKKTKTLPTTKKFFAPHIDVLRIFVPAGTTGGSVTELSAFGEHEFEILLPRGLNVAISPNPHVIEKNGYIVFVWNAKVVGHTPQPVVFDQKD